MLVSSLPYQSDLDDPPYSLAVQDLDRAAKALGKARAVLDMAREYVSDTDADALGRMEDELLGIVGRMERRVEAGEES